jgi:molybdopterin converting factor small subunit
LKIEVRWFASLVEQTGVAAETIDVPEGLDVAGLWSLLTQRHPALAGIRFRPLAACDLAYSEWSRSLAGVREVAFLPPVSGG